MVLLNLQDDLDAEMRRLKVELKQTIDMYSTACKEALTAKQKVREIASTLHNHNWKAFSNIMVIGNGAPTLENGRRTETRRGTDC